MTARVHRVIANDLDRDLQHRNHLLVGSAQARLDACSGHQPLVDHLGIQGMEPLYLEDVLTGSLFQTFPRGT